MSEINKLNGPATTYKDGVREGNFIDLLDTFSCWVLFCHKNPKSVGFYILIKSSVCNLSRFFDIINPAGKSTY